MKKKKILFIGDIGSIHLAKWVDYFCADKDYEVYVATFSQENKTQCKNMFVLSDRKSSVRGGNYYYLLSIFKLAKIISIIKPDFINAHFSYSMGFISLLSLWISREKSEFSVACHGSDILDYPLWVCKYINKLVLANANKIVAVSHPIAKKIRDMGFTEKKLFVGQYGIVVPDLVLRKREIDIISFRNYVPNSRVDELLEQISKIKNIINKRVVFILPLISQKDYNRLRKLYPNFNLYYKISHDQILSFLENSKVYISGTKSDGTSLSLIEAMAYGAIPVVSDIEANRCWIKDGENGKLFSNMEDIGKSLEEIFEMAIEKQEKIRLLNNRKIFKDCNYDIQMSNLKVYLFES